MIKKGKKPSIKQEDLGENDDGMASKNRVNGEEEEEEREKSTSWTEKKKSLEQNKRFWKMTSHSPLLHVLPPMELETVSGCRDTMGSAHI